MSIHLIEAVRLDHAGKVEKVRWGRGRRKGNGSAGWELAAVEQDVDMVVDALHFGDEVATAFMVGSDLVLGPRVHLVVPQHGIEEIDTLDRDVPGRSLTDLPRF